MSELEGPHGSIRIQHRGVQNGKCVQSQSSMINDPFGPLSEHTRIMRKVKSTTPELYQRLYKGNPHNTLKSYNVNYLLLVVSDQSQYH